MRRGQSAGSSSGLNYPQQQLYQQQLQPQTVTQAGIKPSPSLPAITRSTSPSGFSSIFRPTKWFQRTASGSSRPSPTEPRTSSSTSSIGSGRRPTISGPTDPRPIEGLQSPTSATDPKLGVGLSGLNDRASRSVLDLSSRASTDLNGVSESATGQSGLGDLRRIQKKSWSRSADNLAINPPPPKLVLDTTLEMKIEQYRAGTPSTPVSISSKNLPFPSMPGTPSSPPADYSLHKLRHAHSHSGSASSMQTPIVSALSSSPGARLAPPSPQVAPRKRSFDFDRNKGRALGDAMSSSPSGRGGAFSFYFGGAAKPERKAAQTPMAPIIVEPEDETEATSKRSSQIVHRSGFINRLQNYSPSSPQLSSSKNWKPFKMVLKGSKLYFYKPPHDRAQAIKDLFPLGLVSVVEEDDENEAEAEAEPIKPREDARKKRAFWGRRTHPDLVLKDSSVISGSFEALTHECVFGTTFTKSGPELNDDYKSFAFSVILCLPYLVDRARFEYEFQRCASYLISGAEEAKQEFERDRVSLLVKKYAELHGAPADAANWRVFCQEVLTGRNPEKPEVETSNIDITKATPEYGFTPTTTTPIMTPIDRFQSSSTSSVFNTPSSRGSPSRHGKSSSRRVKALLEQAGFTLEAFLKLDPEIVSHSLVLHSRANLLAGRQVTAELLLSEMASTPSVDFFGCDEAPHWLTRLVVSQILGPGPRSMKDNGKSGSSRTHVRAEIIGRWTRVAEQCRHAGDECSWKAIMFALCSKPVARLEKAWRRADAGVLNAVRSWVTTSESARIQPQKLTFWGGDLRYKTLRLLEELHDGKSNEWLIASMQEIYSAWNQFKALIDGCVSKHDTLDEVPDDDDLFCLTQLWKDVSREPVHPKFRQITQYMSMSFAAEPRKKGLFAAHYWSRQSKLGQQALVPLLFPEPLPTITLIDRSQLVRTKKLSYDTFGDPQPVRPIELNKTMDASGGVRVIHPYHHHDIRRGTNFDFGGMILPVFEGELLLCVVPAEAGPKTTDIKRSETPSEELSENVTPSRTPSIRVKSAAAGLDRKTSRARRSSLPTLSQRQTAVTMVEQNGDPPLRALVQAGTLDALVHFLIHGLEGVSVSVADDNGEMALHDKKTRAVKVDRSEFAVVWWQSFRSYVSPYVLFQLLRKEYLSSSPQKGSLLYEDIRQAVKSKQDVLRTLSEWLQMGSGAQDALDDPELHGAMESFLSMQSDKDLPTMSESPGALAQLLTDVENDRSKLLRLFTESTLRPQMKHTPVRRSSLPNIAHNFGVRPPQLEETSPSGLVENLDAMASAAFRNINQEDLFVTSDLFEVQTADATGWFLSKEPCALTEEIEIQTIYSYLMEIEPTPLIGELSGDSLYRLLPPGVRSLIRAYNILRKWAICALVAPQIGFKARHARMELFLRAIEICRLRSIDPQSLSEDVSLAQVPCVRSFVESVLTSAIVSPESRLFAQVWASVAHARNATPDSLISLLHVRPVEAAENTSRLTVDPAWLLERLLEIISLPDVLDSPMETPLSLVNYDKRRQIYNVVQNASSYASRGGRQRREMDRSDFERLNKIEQEFGSIPIDLRALREEALLEASLAGFAALSSKRSQIRPFQRSVAAQQEKLKRDKYLRERFLKEKRQAQQKQERKEDDLNRAMDTRHPLQSTGPKHQRSKRSMSVLFNLMRPISTAFTSESTIPVRRSATELDFVPAQKPSVVLSLVESQVTAFINNERSFTFQLDTEDGGHYLLQALSKNDMNEWIETIRTSVRSHAQRRLTYVGPVESNQLQISDHNQPRPVSSSRDPTAVFGVDLNFLVRREAGGGEASPDAVPKVLELCLKEIEERGLTELGIYRVAGATTEVNALRDALNNGQSYIDSYTDINAVCGVVKYWFRVLPETVIPEMFFEPILDAARLPDLDERLAKIREIIHLFPRAHFSVLKRLAEHLDRVADYEEQNHMTPDNLATVICPNLLRAPNNNFGLIMKNMGSIIVLFKALITHVHFIFDEAEAEAEEAEEAEEEEENADVTDAAGLAEDEDLTIVGERLLSSPEPDVDLAVMSPSP